MKYAVALMTFFDNDLQIKIVDGDNWREALVKAFPEMDWLKNTDLTTAQEEAFNSDVLFKIKRIED